MALAEQTVVVTGTDAAAKELPRLAGLGIQMTVRELLDTLAGIQEAVLIYQCNRRRPRARRMLTETSPEQEALTSLFDLDAYAPTR